MPGSNKVVRTRSRGKDDNTGLLRRIRNVTSLQVRNLTPFPVRDEFASALGQPSEQPQFTTHGHLSDDLDLTMSRRRGRRRSTTSASALSWQSPPEHDPGPTEESPGRRRAMSRASIAASPNVGAISTPKARSSGSTLPTRPPLRQRTVSTASSISYRTSHSYDTAMPASIPSLSRFLPDTSQDTLEHIIQSRLVETFMTITIVPTEGRATEPVLQPPPSGNRSAAPVTNHDELKTGRRSTITSTVNGSPSRSSPFSKNSTFGGAAGSSIVKPGPSGHSKAASISSLPNGKTPIKPSASKPLSQRTPIPRSLVSQKTSLSHFPSSASEQHCEAPVPDYISPILRSSTNPCYEIDPQGGFEFSPEADLGSSRMEVEIWGRLSRDVKGIGKGKQREQPFSSGGRADGAQDWQVLKTWDVDLNQLVALNDDLAQHPSRLPSNTLCITLEPSGHTYYLPSSHSSTTLFRRSRSPSPSIGYNSDPESNVREVGIRTPIKPKLHPHSDNTDASVPQEEPSGDAEGSNAHWKRQRTSASWQSMMKLVTLQTVIQDTERSVADLNREIAPYLVDMSITALNREISERQALVHDLSYEISRLEERSEALRRQIREKRERIEARRNLLAAADELHWEDVREGSNQEILVEEARTDLLVLRNRLAPIRNELLSTLVFIFPIELLSPPDLLFTILDIPLPIPTGPTDPAPPLSLHSHKDITEDSVSTALGYAAQLVQLLAAYLGQRLVYPITCVGSRSVVKDGISAMVGPRMFPLFSKGVDTYRFEYGVFLLNKDIEMLMSERDLRALDMRHTLPNLKNLLLTVTDPDAISPRPHRASSIASTTISALQSPTLVPSINLVDAEGQETPSETDTDVVARQNPPRIEIDSPPPSGSTTPTATETATTPTNTVRKARTFLDLTPISGLWRARNSSSSRSSIKAEPPLEDDRTGEATPTIASALPNFVQQQQGSYGVSGDDEDDRRTIRGEASSEDDVPERKPPSKGRTKSTMNGNRFDHSRKGTAEEKLAEQLRTSAVDEKGQIGLGQHANASRLTTHGGSKLSAPQAFSTSPSVRDGIVEQYNGWT
ncbi:hypothetical protein BDW22DRAFT_1483181 [Trametopsis cervina]|nr:hypothetical protein BDW22DRAFT_1483181 [Trametopsis cervina]